MSMRTPHRAAGIALGLALMAAGTAAGAATHRVRIEAMRFSPETLSVAPGDEVVWENRDWVPHTATAADAADGPGFDSGPIAPGASWSLVARAGGRFAYVCTLHPTMKAQLVVQPR
jgi:plastocyanin